MALSSLFQTNDYDLTCRSLIVTGTVELPCIDQLVNVGAGAEVYDENSCGSLRTLVGDESGIETAVDGDELIISCTVEGANVCPMTPCVGGIYVDKVGDQLRFKSLIAGANVSLNATATGIEISATGAAPGVAGASNWPGDGAVFDTLMGSTLAFRALNGTANGLAVTQGATSITIDNTLAASNVGGGVGLSRDKVGALLNMRSLVAGPAISISATADEVTIGAPTALTALTSVGVGTPVYDGLTSSSIRSLAGSASGVAVSEAGGTITIANTLTGANGVGGTPLFNGKTANVLAFNSLVAGPNITLTPGVGVVSISSAGGGITTLANEGAGARVWDQTTPATLRSVLGSADGVEVAEGLDAITISSTITGANMGSGGGELFESKVGPTLGFRRLAAGVGMNVVTIGSTVTASNTAPDQIVTLTAGAGIVVTGSYPSYTIASAGATMPTLVNTQAFTASGAWDKATAVAAGATRVTCMLCGGGAGAQSGRQHNSDGRGAGGMPGSMLVVKDVPVGVLGAAEAVTIGAGGAGGAPSATTANNGGADGSSTTFYAYKVLGGGASIAPFQPDGSNSALSTSSWEGETFLGEVATRVAAAVGDSGPYEFAIPGRGSYGGRSNPATDSSAATVGCSSLAGAPATTAGSSSGPGVTATTAFNTYYGCGGSGGSGTASNSHPGGNGYRGSGGGGGGGCVSGTAGAGGAGGAGWVLIIAYS